VTAGQCETNWGGFVADSYSIYFLLDTCNHITI
jgi:hypothetical protein